MDCLKPQLLKSGIVVPCGQCPNCRSRLRNEWSYRLQMQVKYSDKMPLFITLTYDDEHLPHVSDRDPDVADWVIELRRDDVSSFLKEYKRKFGLLNNQFQYFGCGEYGDQFGRPHYHLLFFGDDELYQLFWQDAQLAEDRIREVWKGGYVNVCQADFGGIHYVTKYVLKDQLDNVPPEATLPFTISSKHLGCGYLKSPEFLEKQRKFMYAHIHIDELFELVPFVPLDLTTLNHYIDIVKNWLPDLTVHLDDNTRIYLPRYYRRKLIGSFECWKDNPLWLLRHLENLRDSLIYLRDWSEYDHTHEKSHWQEMVESHCIRINNNLALRRSKKRV